MSQPQYLGDGVYASSDPSGMFPLVLTTGHHDPMAVQARNVIYFEPEVLAALEKYIEELKKK